MQVENMKFHVFVCVLLCPDVVEGGMHAVHVSPFLRLSSMMAPPERPGQLHRTVESGESARASDVSTVGGGWPPQLVEEKIHPDAPFTARLVPQSHRVRPLHRIRVPGRVRASQQKSRSSRVKVWFGSQHLLVGRVKTCQNPPGTAGSHHLVLVGGTSTFQQVSEMEGWESPGWRSQLVSCSQAAGKSGSAPPPRHVRSLKAFLLATFPLLQVNPVDHPPQKVS